MSISISQIVKTSILGLGALMYKSRKSKLLYYHDIYEGQQYTPMGTPLDVFKRHIEAIRDECYQIAPRIMSKEGEVAVLFDDGFRGIYDVRHFFYDEHICPTVFLAVELIGKEGYLTKEEILELQEHGFIFECHCWSHKDLTTFSDKELIRELKDSKDYLSELLGKKVTEICLPIGYFSDHLLEQIRKYGYKEVYSSVPGDYNELVGGMMRPRHLLQYATPREVRYILRGGNNILKSHYEKQHHKG